MTMQLTHRPTNAADHEASSRFHPVQPARSLRRITTGEMRRPGNSRLTEAIVSKLHSLDDGKFVDRQVTTKARVLLEVLRDTLTGRYPHLSVAAFADVLVAMDHFIEVSDAIPDTWERGMEDDYRRIAAVWKEHGREIASYQGWKTIEASRGA